LKEIQDAICPNCEWSGDAMGLSKCPVCGADIAPLTETDDLGVKLNQDEKYPADIVAETDEKELAEEI